MNHKIELFWQDPRAYVSYLFFALKTVPISCFSTLFCRLKMGVAGIEYGRNVCFHGNAILSRAPQSFIKIGDNCTFNSSSLFNNRGINHKCIVATQQGACIKIGIGCGFSGVSIVSSNSVTIGNNVLVGTNCMIGDRNDHEDRFPQFPPKPVVIGNNVWIGMNSTIMRGVTVGDNSIIGANSLVTKDVPSNVIAAGIPAKIIKAIE